MLTSNTVDLKLLRGGPLLIIEVDDDGILQWDRFSPGNASMKRPTRPFVVEVKKKRGSPANPRSIWGDLDLSALAADPLAATELTSEPVGNDRNTNPVGVDSAGQTDSPTSVILENRDAHAVADATHVEPDLGEVETEGAAGEPARSSRKRIRRRDEPTQPRGQRWKRRLPKALRR